METLFYILLVLLGIAAYSYYKAQFLMDTPSYQLKMYYSKAKDNDEIRKLSYVIISRYLNCELTEVKSKYIELIKSNTRSEMVDFSALYDLSNLEKEKFDIPREITPSGIMSSWLLEYNKANSNGLNIFSRFNIH